MKIKGVNIRHYFNKGLKPVLVFESDNQTHKNYPIYIQLSYKGRLSRFKSIVLSEIASKTYFFTTNSYEFAVISEREAFVLGNLMDKYRDHPSFNIIGIADWAMPLANGIENFAEENRKKIVHEFIEGLPDLSKNNNNFSLAVKKNLIELSNISLQNLLSDILPKLYPDSIENLIRDYFMAKEFDFYSLIIDYLNDKGYGSPSKFTIYHWLFKDLKSDFTTYYLEQSTFASTGFTDFLTTDFKSDYSSVLENMLETHPYLKEFKSDVLIIKV